MPGTRRRFLELLGLGAVSAAVAPSAVPGLTVERVRQVKAAALRSRVVADVYSIPVKFRTHDALWLRAARDHAVKNDNVRAP